MIKYSIYFLALAMGCCGLAYEYNFSKLSSDLLGNSEKQWAMVIGLMMFAMGIGAEYQKKITDDHLIYKFSYLEVILSILGGWGPLFLFWVFGEARDYFLLSQFALTFIVGMIIGMEIPLLARMNEHFIKSLKTNLGGIMGKDYIGAFIGTIVWVFVLLGNQSIFQISILVALFNLFACSLVTIGLTRLEKPSLWRKKIVLALFFVTCVSLTAGYFYSPKIEGIFEQKLFSDPIVLSTTTKYQHIVLTQSRAGEIFCYINGNLQFSSYDEYIYHEYLIHPAMNIAPRRNNVLILGGGDGLALREVLKYSDVKKVTLVDIDPMMIKIASENKYLLKLNKGSLLNQKVDFKSPMNRENQSRDLNKKAIYLKNKTKFSRNDDKIKVEVAIINTDAKRFLENTIGYYDVIIIDFPDPNSVNLAKLYSLSFYSEVIRRLSPRGIVVQQSTSPHLAKEAFLCIGRTWKESKFAMVPFHEYIPTFGEWGWWIGGDSRYYSKEKLINNLNTIKKIPVETKFIHPNLIKKSLVFGKNVLKSSYNTHNTVINNVVYQYYENSINQFR